jgi:hypothetical protein
VMTGGRGGRGSLNGRQWPGARASKNWFVQQKPLNIYKWHQILITELEHGAVGTDFSKRTSWPEKGQNMEVNEKQRNVYNYKQCSNMYRIHIVLDETGCVLNEKMMPDLTVMVPELEIDRQISKIHISNEKCTGPGMRALTCCTLVGHILTRFDMFRTLVGHFVETCRILVGHVSDTFLKYV